MRNGVDYLGRDSLGICQGKMGYIRKNAIVLCPFYMQKIAFYLKPIQIISIKMNKSSKYFKNKKNENAYFVVIICNGTKWTTSLFTVFLFS